MDNLKLIRNCGWVWLTRLKSNRVVNLNRQGPRALSDTAISAAGTEAWLTGFGLVKVFGIATLDGGTAHGATNDLGMTALTRAQVAEFSWAIETCFRDLKQIAGGGHQQVRGVASNVGCFHLCAWAVTLTEAWAWNQKAEDLVAHRAASRWGDATRRPSHADKRRAW